MSSRQIITELLSPIDQLNALSVEVILNYDQRIELLNVLNVTKLYNHRRMEFELAKVIARTCVSDQPKGLFSIDQLNLLPEEVTNSVLYEYYR